MYNHKLVILTALSLYASIWEQLDTLVYQMICYAQT